MSRTFRFKPTARSQRQRGSAAKMCANAGVPGVSCLDPKQACPGAVSPVVGGPGALRHGHAADTGPQGRKSCSKAPRTANSALRSLGQMNRENAPDARCSAAACPFPPTVRPQTIPDKPRTRAAQSFQSLVTPGLPRRRREYAPIHTQDSTHTRRPALHGQSVHAVRARPGKG